MIAPSSPPLFADRLGQSVPRDARATLEICAPGASVASRVKAANPQIRFAVVQIPVEGRTAPDLAALLGPARPLFDCLVVHDAVLGLADPFALIAAAGRYLASSGMALFVFPRSWVERREAENGMERMRWAPEFLSQACALTMDNAIIVAPPGQDPGVVDNAYFIVRAIPASQPLRRLAIQAMTLKPVGACNDTRIYLPHACLAAVPGVRVQASVDHITRLPVSPPNEQRVAILQRRISNASDLRHLKRIIQEGYLIIAEFDDHPSHWPDIAKHDNLTFRAVHAVQTSTDFLAGELRPFNDEIAVFPNQMAILPPRRQPRQDGRVTLFFGAFNRDEDWRPLMDAINRTIAAHPGRVDVQVIHDRGFYEALETVDKSFTPACGYDEYISVLRRCDIGLLPLNDTLFNRCKSDLKFIECAAYGVAALVSPVVYGEVVADGETGLMFRTPEEFAVHLERLVVDDALRTGIAGRAYDYIARSRLLARHFRKRLDWYWSLLDRKAELDAQLFARVPELRP